MQVQHKKPGPDPLKQAATLNGVRAEANRSILVEKKQPPRSIFDIGSFRHNVNTKQESEHYRDLAIS